MGLLAKNSASNLSLSTKYANLYFQLVHNLIEEFKFKIILYGLNLFQLELFKCDIDLKKIKCSFEGQNVFL